MEERVEKQRRPKRAAPALAGGFWFAGWLFTCAFANLIWWKWIVGLVIWPYYLGLAVR